PSRANRVKPNDCPKPAILDVVADAPRAVRRDLHCNLVRHGRVRFREGFEGKPTTLVVAMQLSIHTLISISTGIGILMAGAATRSELVSALIFALPLIAMAIAITCPKRGNQLDPRGYWFLALVFKTWLTIVCCGVLGAFFAVLFPSLDERIDRWLNPRDYMVLSNTPFIGDERLFRTVEQRVVSTEGLEVIDVDGNIGSVDSIQRGEWVNPETNLREECFILVVRSERRFLWSSRMLEAHFRNDERLHLTHSSMQ
ncbi:MAG: hypothetical protein AAFX06_28175, partial [Planctomycetota bacterium]